MDKDPERDPDRGQAKVPPPPSRDDLDALSKAQRLVTDDWTGEGGAPPGKAPRGR